MFESAHANDTLALHYNVTVPGLDLVERAQEIAREINALSSEADAISIVNTVRGYRQLRAVEKKKAELRPRYGTLLGEALGAMRGSVEGAPAIMANHLQTQALGRALAATLLLQNQWQRLSGTCDRKAAYLIASGSTLIALLSLVLSVVFGTVSLL